MDIFEVMESFDPESPADDRTALLWYLQKGDEARAAPLLHRAGMLDRETAKKCLTAALTNCSAELFGALLDHAPRREYAGSWPDEEDLAAPAGEPKSGGFQVSGTLPTLAAAMGKAEHLRLLLDWGCDVNSASLDAATALGAVWHKGARERNLRGYPTVSRGSVARWDGGSTASTVIYGLTPLAAGILFGSLPCVRLLLEREGVWLTEAPGVSEALALRRKRWDTEAHRACRRLVRTKPDGSPRPLALWAAIRFMNAAALRDELSRCAYSREELSRAALVLMDDKNKLKKTIWTMLAALGDRDMEALRDERVRRRMAAMIYCDFDGKDEPLPDIAEQALGDTVDLDESTVGAANYSAPVAEMCLKRFGENRRLVMSRDVISDSSTVTASALRVFLRYVEFRAPSLPVGISALTAAIVKSGDVRLLRRALHRGLIPAEESTEALLEFAGKNTAARALLLTSPRPSVSCAPPGAEEESFRMLSRDEEKRVLADPALRAMASDAVLLDLSLGRSMLGGITILRDLEDDSEGDFEVMDYAALCALRGETDVVLRCALLRIGGTEHANRVNVFRKGGEAYNNMYITLLCCAALGGRTETVRAMLDAGFDPEERDMGQTSHVDTGPCGGGSLKLSPLLCALLWRRWDTAALLLERGARCDLTSYTVKWAFDWARGGDVPYAEIRRELGAYLEGGRLGRAGRIGGEAVQQAKF